MRSAGLERSGELSNENITYKVIRSMGLLQKLFDNKSREIIHVYDNETGDLIRQIPPKEMIELVDKLEEVAGIIFNNKV